MSPADLANRLQQHGLFGLVLDIAARRNVLPEDILGRRRGKLVMAARKDLYVALRERGMSYPEIGAMLDRDHTTVLSGCRSRVRVAVEAAWR